MPRRAPAVSSPAPLAAQREVEGGSGSSFGERFSVSLDNFLGPFDLLLSLIAKREMDITEVALARVADEFAAYIAAQGDDWPISEASEFLVVAATLLDLKAASLLPGGLAESEDLELLEARDLLFARLLEYRAFKRAATTVERQLAEQARYRPRSVELEPQFANLLPALVWALSPLQLAALAEQALSRPPKPVHIPLEHLHAPGVSVAEQARVLGQRLAAAGQATFRSLIADAADALPVIVARFVALLEMFRLGQVVFDQGEALGELWVKWTGLTVEVEISEEFE